MGPICGRYGADIGPIWGDIGPIGRPIGGRYGAVWIRYGSDMGRYGAVMGPMWCRHTQTTVTDVFSMPGSTMFVKSNEFRERSAEGRQWYGGKGMYEGFRSLTSAPALYDIRFRHKTTPFSLVSTNMLAGHLAMRVEASRPQRSTSSNGMAAKQRGFFSTLFR